MTHSREVAWGRRPQAAALIAAPADPGRRWGAIVIGEHERAFYGSQYALMAPLFEHYGIQLWMPEVGAPIASWSTRPTSPWGIARCNGGNLPDGWVISDGPPARPWSARPISSPPSTSARPPVRCRTAILTYRAGGGTCWPAC